MVVSASADDLAGQTDLLASGYLGEHALAAEHSLLRPEG
jgi:hypothetical protein